MMNIFTYAGNALTFSILDKILEAGTLATKNEKDAKNLFVARNAVEGLRAVKMGRGVIGKNGSVVTRALCAMDAFKSGARVADRAVSTNAHEGSTLSDKAGAEVARLRGDSNRVKIAEHVWSGLSKATHVATDVVKKNDKIQQAHGFVSDQLNSAPAPVKEKVEKAMSFAETAAHKASDKTDEVSSKLPDNSDNVAEKVNEVAKKADKITTKAANKVSEKKNEVFKSSTETNGVDGTKDAHDLKPTDLAKAGHGESVEPIDVDKVTAEETEAAVIGEKDNGKAENVVRRI